MPLYLSLIIAVGILTFLGLLFGILLTICSKKFAVKEDERIDEVSKMLPNYNCGSCGYAGCRQLAEALVKHKEKLVSKCRPSKPEVKDAIIKYLAEHPDEDGTPIVVNK